MADGSLIFDTKIDNTGAQTGLSGLKRLITAGMAAVVAKQVGELAKVGIAYNSQMDDFKAKFKVLLGSADEASKHVQMLRNMAIKTPFRTTDLAEASQQLLAFGVNSRDVRKDLQMLGDISLGNKEKFQQLSLVFGQVSSQGKLMGQDLLQYINAGFNPLKELEKMGRGTYSELKDQMSQGKITAEDVAAAMEHATSKGGQFFNGMKEGSKTFSAQMDALKGNLQILLGNAFRPLYDFLVKITPKLASLVSAMNKHPKAIAAVTKAILGLTAAMTAYYVASKWDQFASIITTSLTRSKVAIKEFSSVMGSLSSVVTMTLTRNVNAGMAVGDFITNLPARISAAMSKTGSAITSGLGAIKNFAFSWAGLAVGIGAATVALGLWVNKVGGVDKAQAIIQQKISNFTARVPEIVNNIGAALQAGGAILTQVVTETLPAIGRAIWKALPAAITLIGNLLGQLGTWLAQKAAGLGDKLAAEIPKIAQKIADGIPAAIDALVQWITTPGDAAAKSAGAHVGETGASAVIESLLMGLLKLAVAIVTAMPQVMLGIVQGLWAAAPTILTAIGQLGMMILNALVAGIGNLVLIFGTWLAGINTAIASKASAIGQAVWSFAASLPGKIISGLGSLVAVAINWLAGFTSGIGTGFGRAFSTATSYARSLPGRISGALGSLYGIGVNFLQGLVNGIRDGFSRAFSIINSLGSKCKSALKHVFDVHSPSKFTYWIGAMLMAGLGNGIVKNTRMVVRGIKTQMQDVKNAFGIDTPMITPKVPSLGAMMAVKSAGQDGSDSGATVNQTININQPVSSPIETARAIKNQAITLGLAGV